MNIISSKFLSALVFGYILLSAAVFQSPLHADQWLDQFIKYSDDGKTLRYFPRFLEEPWTVPEGVEKIGNGAFAHGS